MDCLETLKISGDFNLRHLPASLQREMFHFIPRLAGRALVLFTFLRAHSLLFLGLCSESHSVNSFSRSLAHSIASLHPLSKLWFLELARKFFPYLLNCSPIFSLCCCIFGYLGRGLALPALVPSIMHTYRAFLYPVFQF